MKKALVLLTLIFTLPFIGNTQKDSHKTLEQIFSPRNENLKNRISSHRLTSNKEYANHINIRGVRQKLDSVVYPNLSGITGGYDKDCFSYDDLGNNIQEISYGGDLVSGIRKPIFKGDYTYDTKGNGLTDIISDWDINTEAWKFESKTENSYDVNNYLIHKIEYNWLGSWVESNKLDYTYDGDQKIINSIISDWDFANDQWTNGYKVGYSYDANGKLALIIMSNWNENTNEWDSTEKTIYKNDVNGNLVYKEGSYWDDDLSNWVIHTKKELAYNGNNDIVEESYLEWSESDSVWYTAYKSELIYDNELNLESVNVLFWDNNTSMWYVEFKQEYSYNNDYAFSDLILPYQEMELDDDFSINLFFRHMLTQAKGLEWDDESNTWEIEDQANFYYSALGTNQTENIKEEELSVFPNPFVDKVSIDFKNIEVQEEHILKLYNTQGKQVYAGAIKNQEELDLSTLGRGIYIYNIITKGQVLTGRIIKQ